VALTEAIIRGDLGVMNRRIAAAQVCLLGLLLAGCGGGSGSGMVSTPPPAPPPTPATYSTMQQKIDGGSYTFQTTGVAYSGSPAGFAGASSFALGSGATIAYNELNDTFTVTAPGGSGVTFTAANLVPSAPGTVHLNKPSGASVDDVLITIPLTYAMITVWNQQTPSRVTGRISIGGSQTQTSDVPKSGSASYAVTVAGAAQSNGTVYNLTSSTGSLSANFAAGTVQTSLTLAGPPDAGGAVSNFGTFSGTGNLASGGPGFSGTLSGGTSNGIFHGAFFGPQAAEAGYGFVLPGSGFSAAGVVFGAKQ
jgi:hypothetical protein